MSKLSKIKSYLLLSLFILASSISISETTKLENFDSQEKYVNLEVQISKTEHADLRTVDYKFADYFLENTKIKKEIADEFLIILPDVRILEKQKDKISKLGKDVIVFILKEKNKKLEFRSIEEMKNKKFGKNVKLIPVSLNDNEIDRFIVDTVDNSLYFQEYFINVFYNNYKKITKYDYLGVLNK